MIGSTPVPRALRPRRRRRGGMFSPQRTRKIIAEALTKAGVQVTQPSPKHGKVIGVCPQHLAEDAELLAALGFMTIHEVSLYADDLSRRKRGKPASVVVLPPEKRPAGIVKAVLVRCLKCKSRDSMCTNCGGHWGLRMYTSKKTKDHTCREAT